MGGTAHALSDGTNVVSFFPEYDIKFNHRKIESEHRTRTGAAYKYIWGNFRSVKLKIEFLSSADMTIVNSWWGANVPVVLYNMDSVAIVSGYLGNATAPIDQYVKPYTDLFMGMIELESF